MCTGLRFTDNNGNLFFGRNLDVASDYGEKVLVTPRNYPLPYQFLPDSKTTKAIIGMGIMNGDYPMYFDACNENGLGIAGLNFPGFAYFPKEPVTGKKNMAPYEFMMWVLEEFDTATEAKEGLKELSLLDAPASPQMPTPPLHWFISDNQNTLVVETTKAHGVQVYDDPVGVLTNNPEFPWHLMNLNNYVGLNPQDAAPSMWNKQEVKGLGVGTGSWGLPGDSIPASRFVKVAYLNANYPTVKTETENVAKFFNILKSVAMINGSVVNDAGERELTIYSACYSANTKTYYYNRHDDFTLRQVQLNDDNMNATKITIY